MPKFDGRMCIGRKWHACRFGRLASLSGNGVSTIYSATYIAARTTAAMVSNVGTNSDSCSS